MTEIFIGKLIERITWKTVAKTIQKRLDSEPLTGMDISTTKASIRLIIKDVLSIHVDSRHMSYFKISIVSLSDKRFFIALSTKDKKLADWILSLD